MRLEVKENRLKVGKIWTPADDAYIWYDPSDESTITLQTGVAVMLDKGSAGFDMLQSTDTKQPSYIRHENGLYMLSFDTSNYQFMKYDIINWTISDYELFIAFKCGTPGPNRSVISLSGSSSTFQIDGGSTWEGRMNTSNFGAPYFDTADNTNKSLILSYTSDKTNQLLKGYKGYEEKFSVSNFTGFDDANTSLKLAVNRNDSVFSGLYLYEMFVLPMGNRYEAVNYLKKKWGI